MTNPMNHETLLTKEQVRQRLSLNTLRGVDCLLKAHGIPVIRLGHKTPRVLSADIEALLLKLVTRAAR
jgi:hypothetical protein